MDYGEAKKVVVSCNESSVDDWVVSYYTLQGGDWWWWESGVRGSYGGCLYHHFARGRGP